MTQTPSDGTFVAGQNLERPQMIPALDVLPSQGLSPHSEISARRAVGLWRLASGRATITVAPVGAAASCA